jgi:uncharacterized protein YjaZ
MQNRFTIFCTLLMLLIIRNGFCQGVFNLKTSDIDNYWNAYDKLAIATSKTDSVQIFQEHYINKATKEYNEFMKSKGCTASEYVSNISKFPKFWKSMRLQAGFKNQSIIENINRVNNVFDSAFSNFKAPEIYIGFGCFTSGGTTSKNKLLIAAEIAAADSAIDISELPQYLKNILGNNDIISYIAHETVHTLQHGFPMGEILKLAKYKRLNLLNMAITEGSADFITTRLFGLNINKRIFTYGEKNECNLWKEFEKSFKSEPFSYRGWLHNFRSVKGKPADLGYYVGYKITEAFYNRAKDKKKSLRSILNRGKYKRVFRGSKYDETIICS